MGSGDEAGWWTGREGGVGVNGGFLLSCSIMLGLRRTWLLVVVCIMSASGTVTICVEFAHMSFVL
jgi:hypothetical protein